MTGSRRVIRSLMAVGAGAAVLVGVSRMIVGAASGPDSLPPLVEATLDYATAAVLVFGAVMATAVACFSLAWGRARIPARVGTAVGLGFVGAAAVVEVARWLLIPAVQDRRMDLSASAAAFVDRFADVLDVAHFALLAGALALVLTLRWLIRRQPEAVK